MTGSRDTSQITILPHCIKLLRLLLCIGLAPSEWRTKIIWSRRATDRASASGRAGGGEACSNARRALWGSGGEPANEEVEQRRRRMRRAKLEQRGAIGRGERERGRHWSRRRRDGGGRQREHASGVRGGDIDHDLEDGRCRAARAPSPLQGDPSYGLQD